MSQLQVQLRLRYSDFVAGVPAAAPPDTGVSRGSSGAHDRSHGAPEMSSAMINNELAAAALKLVEAGIGGWGAVRRVWRAGNESGRGTLEP